MISLRWVLLAVESRMIGECKLCCASSMFVLQVLLSSIFSVHQQQMIIKMTPSQVL